MKEERSERYFRYWMRMKMPDLEIARKALAFPESDKEA